MVKKLVFLFALPVLLSCNNTDIQNDIKKVESLVNQIRVQLSPDKRDLIFRAKIISRKGKFVLKGVTDLAVLKQKLFVILKQEGYEVVDSLRLLPEEKFKMLFGVTRQPVANLRASPKHTSELVTQTLMGMPLQIYEEQNGFYHVKTPENYYAWIDAAGMTIMDSVQFNKWLSIPKIIVTKHCGKVFNTPYPNAQPVSDFVLNDVFGFVAIQGDYTEVVYPDGRRGFIHNDAYLGLDEFVDNCNHADTSVLIHEAKQFLGIPYLWGGTSSKGLDCSGFTKNVFARFGYNLPRDASQQVRFGLVLSITPEFTNLQPGDLLFFGHKKNGGEKITHVALHLGNGRIIHATGEVKIESLNKNDPDFNPARYKSLLQARRLIDNIDKDFVKYYTPSYLKSGNK